MNNNFIINAEIVSTLLGYEGHGILTYMIYFGYDGHSTQGIGGYALGKEYTTKVIEGLLKTLDVESWEKLKGTYVRIEKENGGNGKILKIGHLLKDKWFDPANI